MKTLKKLVSVLLTLVIICSLCASSFALEPNEAPQPYGTLTVSASLSSTRVSATGRSTEAENLDVSFDLFDSSGNRITSGSNSGSGRVTASKSVSLSSGNYRVAATVSNGIISTTRSFSFTI